MMGADESSKHARVRWLDAVRYAIAGVVTVLTIAVIAWAIFQSLRPEVLNLTVANGYVTVDRIKSMSPPVSVGIHLKVESINLGGRAAIVYDNVTVHFLYSNKQEITYIEVPNPIFVGPRIERDDILGSSELQAPADVGMEFVKKMFRRQQVRNATVVLEGTMQTQTSALNYTRGRYTKYSCFPVTIGTSPEKGGADVNVLCTVGYNRL